MARERYQIGDLTLDVGAAQLARGGREVALPRLSFELLVALVRQAPNVVGAEELIATVWAGTAVADETLTQRVTLLRKALGDDAAAPTYLRAVRGRGYQLVAAVLRLEEPEAPAGRRRWRGWAAAGIAAVIATTVTFWPRPTPPPAAPVTTQPASAMELLERADTYLARERLEDNEIALDLYRRAHQAGGEAAPVLAGWSLALSQRATKFNGSGETVREALERARRAVELAPGLGRAHHALGLALDAQGRVESAIAAYRRAVELDSGDRAALASAAHLLAVRGDLAAALEGDLAAGLTGLGAGPEPERPPYLDVQIGTVLALLGYRPAAAVWFERALALQPDNVFAAVGFARMRLAEGRGGEADGIAARALELGTRRAELEVVRARSALLAGDEAAARHSLAAALEINGRFGLAASLTLVLDGRARGSGLEKRFHQRITELAEARSQGDEWPDSWVEQALLAATFEPDGSAAPLAALDQAIAAGFRDADLLLVDPFAAELRARPGFPARVERIRQRVAREVQGVTGAPWLPAGLIAGSAASK